MNKLYIALTSAFLALTAQSLSAQEMLVYHVVSGNPNRVSTMENGQEIQRNDKIGLTTKITLMPDCMLELLDDINNKRYTILRPGTGTIEELAASNGSIANLTPKYVAYVKNQMKRRDAQLQSPQKLYSFATVTRSLMRKADAQQGGEDDPFGDFLNQSAGQFDSFVNDATAEFDAFVRKIDEEYTDFVAKAWKTFGCEPPKERPVEKQVKPQVKPKKEKKEDDGKADKLKIELVKDVKRVIDLNKLGYEDDNSFALGQPKPLREIKQLPPMGNPELGISEEEAIEQEELYGHMPFSFYGTDMEVRLDESKRFNIGTAIGKTGKFEPQYVANVLKALSDGPYNNLVYDCLQLREKHNLGDWAYLQLLKAVTDQFCGAGTNEAALLMGFVYYKSGYSARFGYDPKTARIYMLFGSKYTIYDKPSYYIDGANYYCMDELPSELSLCEAKYPEEKNLSLYTPSTQKLTNVKTDTRTIVSRRYPEVKINIASNKNIIDYCGTVPSSCLDNDPETQWNSYANAPLDEEVKNQIYPTLKKILDGQTEMGKVNRILDLIQEGMEYEYDDVVWGVPDRIFFAEESLYYPFCDCEDRAILFTRLVRDLVGLPCALVHYQGHLAAAVAFSEDARGVSWLVDGKKYTVCDPTYIGARAGEEMDIVDHNTAILIKLPQ